MEQTAFALGRSEALMQTVPAAALWDRREAVLECRLGGANLSLATLLEAEAVAEEAMESPWFTQARRWLAALRSLREAPGADPVLSPSHWRVAASCLVGKGGGDVRLKGVRFNASGLRALWRRHGGLAAAGSIATGGLRRNPIALPLGRLAAHAVLHHAGLAIAAVAPLAAAALPEAGASPGATPTPRGCGPPEHPTSPLLASGPRTAAWLHRVCQALEERRAVSRLLQEQVSRDAERVSRLPRCAESTLAVLAQFQRTPVATITAVSRAAGLCFPTTLRATLRLLHCGVLREVTGRRSGRVFAYSACLRLLEPADWTEGGRL